MSIDSTQFSWPTSFACTLITENLIVPTSYNINLSIEPITNSPGISAGFKKLRYFIDNYLHNSVFIFQENELVKTFKNIDSNVVLFPTQPYDYFVGSVLYQKFLSITEKYFHIDFISVDSAVGDRIQYSIMDPEDCGLELSGNYWWNTDSTDTGLRPDAKWDDLNIDDLPKFEPKIIKGGRSEN